jgi:hypothetical protein
MCDTGVLNNLITVEVFSVKGKSGVGLFSVALRRYCPLSNCD